MSDQPASSSIDIKTMALIFLLGGGITGAGTSLVGGNGMKDEFKVLVVAIEGLRDDMEGIRGDLITLKSDSRSTEKYRASVESKLDDHEKRIRLLENKRNR